MSSKTYYEILGVAPNASQEEIESQGHFWIQAWHPDKFHKPEEKNRAAEMFKEVNEAYTILRDPTKRASYDWQIKVGQAAGIKSKGPEIKMNRPSIQTGTSLPSPFFACLLSLFLLGGAGQIYIGQKTKGIVLIVASFFLTIFVIGYILIIIGSIDAYVLANKKANGEMITDWQWFWD